MFKNKFKIVFNYLPVKLKMVLLTIYRMIVINRAYNSPDHFPLNYINNLELPIFGKSKTVGYFYRHYQEKRLDYKLLPENLFDYKYEIIHGEYINFSKTVKASKSDIIVPVCLESEKSNLAIKNLNTNDVDKLRHMPENRFHYFKINHGESCNFSSNSSKGFVMGDPIALKQNSQNSKKLVLCIFIDGLADSSQIGPMSDDQIMPNTMRFFSKGVKFKNHFSNAEWTLPSVPSFFSGGRQQFHGFYHPKQYHSIGENYKIISEIFHDNDYLTFQANGNWRVSPAYGYVKGFDRTIYKKEMNVNEVIYSFFEHIRTFRDRDNFVWLTLMDVHHLINVIPDISNQVVNSTSAHCLTPWHDQENKTKSVYISRDKNLTEIYVNEIKRIDYYLKAIYDYIENNYENDEILVSLISDHGQGFLTENQNPLSLGRTKVPWMIRGGGIPQGDSHELTENVDLFDSLLKCSNLQRENYQSESICPTILGGEIDREFVLSQSIYPKKKYKAIIRNKLFEYEFESLNPVTLDGKILGDLNFKDKRQLSNLTKDEDEFTNLEEYKKIIEIKINEWNSRK